MKGPLGALPALSPATRRALVLHALVALADAVATVAFAWGLATAVASVVDGRADLSPLWMVAASVLARSVLAWASQVLAVRAAAAVKGELRAKAVDAALGRGPEYITTRGPDELTYLCTSQLDAIDEYFSTFLPALVSAAVTVPVLGLAVLLADPASAALIAVTAALMPVFAALVGWYTERRVRRATDDAERLAGQLGELIRALPVLAAFRRAAAQRRVVAAVSERQRRSVLGTLRVAFCSALVLELLATLGVALVAVGIGLRLIDGELGLATGLLVLVLAPDCYLPLRAVGAAYHASADGLAAVDKVAEVVGGRRDSGPGNGVRPEPGGHRLDVRELRVARRGGDAPDGASFVLRPGAITRLDSPSGSGKSTIIAVLLGFAAPSGGSVTVDGVDLAALDIAAWRRRVAWVPQRPRFAAATVAEELRLSIVDLKQCAGDDLLVEVTERVHAHQLLHRPVDELSAGERGRVALARALLRIRCGATVLLADEPTAHLDPLTAAAAMRAIGECADDGVAVLLASHREVSPAEEPPAQPSVHTGASRPVNGSSIRLYTSRTAAGIGLGALAALSGVGLTATAAWLIAHAAQHPPVLTLTVAIVAVRTFGLGKAVVRYAERLVTHDAALRTSTSLRTKLWSALARVGPAALVRDGAHRLVSDVDAVRDAIPRVVHPPVVAALVGLVAVGVQTALAPPAGLALAVALLLAGVAGPVLGAGAERRASAALADRRRDLALRVGTLFTAAADLVASGAHRVVRTDIARTDAELRRRARQQAFGAGIASAVTTMALGAAAVLGALCGVWYGTAPVLVPMLALIPLATKEIIDPLAVALTRRRALAAARHRLAAVLDAPAPPADRLTRGPDIALHGVTVGWPGGATPLREVNLVVPRGFWVAVVGPSGCGKSTLLALLLGFLAPAAGRAEIPATVAYCPQDAQLVSTTLAENLRIADAAATDAALATALRTVCLADFADRLDMPITATTVSGGEATRIALARALLAADTADAVLLDEPTAHLDADTAARVLRALRIRLAGRTVLHVTHDPAEAAQADVVLDVREGGVLAKAHW